MTMHYRNRKVTFPFTQTVCSLLPIFSSWSCQCVVPDCCSDLMVASLCQWVHGSSSDGFNMKLLLVPEFNTMQQAHTCPPELLRNTRCFKPDDCAILWFEGMPGRPESWMLGEKVGYNNRKVVYFITPVWRWCCVPENQRICDRKWFGSWTQNCLL